MSALPCAATAGMLVRSPVSDAIGSSLISPFTVSCRCTLCLALVVALDSFSNVAASGSGVSASCDGEHPEVRAGGEEENGEHDNAGRVCMSAS